MKFLLNFLARAGPGVLTAGAGPGAGTKITGVCTALSLASVASSFIGQIIEEEPARKP
jgi:hypothetical protein